MGAETNEPDATSAEEERIKRRHFTVLLSVLSLLLFAGPIIRVLGTGKYADLKAILFSIVFAGLLLSAVVAVDAGRRQASFLYGLAVAWILLRLGSVLLGLAGLMVAGHAVALLFLGFVIVLLLRELLGARSADGETIAAALCVYLIMGVFWAVGYGLTELIQPGSFKVPPGVTLDFTGEGAIYANYFSFVTLTTVGYGDITPNSDATRMMAISEAVFGQVFLVVLVARLVGMSVAERRD